MVINLLAMKISWSTRIIIWIVCVLVGLSAGYIKRIQKTNAESLQRVTVQLDWFPEPEHGGLYQALAKGWFKDEGLDVVLIPGGGDVNPKWYGEEPNTDQLYGIDDLQDENDFSIAKYALDNGLPTLAICRGFQLVNVLKGGSLVQDMEEDHRNHLHEVTITKDLEGLGLSQPVLGSSCYHHQSIKQLGEGLEVLATAAEGHVEAYKIDAKAWAYGVQWHPEDNYKDNPQQMELFNKFVSEARKF